MMTRSVFAGLFVGLVGVGACSSEDATAIVPEDAGPPAPPPPKPDRAEAEHFLGMAVPRAEIAPERYCEMGEERACNPPSRSMSIHGGPMMHCMQYSDGSFRFNRADCNTPLVVSFDGAPVTFTAASAAFPVGVSERTEWVSAETPWLALDRDGSGCIESERELFAGFAPLAALDDNGDGVIDASDPAFASLVLWADRDQDKRCTPGELTTLRAAGIIALELTFATPENPSATSTGSHEGEVSLVHVRGNGRSARLVDAYLAPLPAVH